MCAAALCDAWIFAQTLRLKPAFLFEYNAKKSDVRGPHQEPQRDKAHSSVIPDESFFLLVLTQSLALIP